MTRTSLFLDARYGQRWERFKAAPEIISRLTRLSFQKNGARRRDRCSFHISAVAFKREAIKVFKRAVSHRKQKMPVGTNSRWTSFLRRCCKDAHHEERVGTAIANRIVSISEAAHLTSLSRSQIRRLELADRFPRRVQIGAGRVGYLLTEIEHYIDNRPRAPRLRRKL